MTQEQRTGSGWVRFRKWFRWCRILVLLLVFFAVGLIVYLNQAGLPKFLSSQVSAELARRGFDVAFSTLHLDGYRKIIVRNLRFGERETGTPWMFIKEAVVRLDSSAMKQGQFLIDGLSVTEGRIVVPLESSTLTNQFVLEHIQTELSFRTNNNWVLSHGEGFAFGARLLLSGNITNAPDFQKITPRSTNSPGWFEYLQHFVKAMELLKFQGHPHVSLAISGDARNLMTMNAAFRLQSRAARNVWANYENLDIRASLSSKERGLHAEFESTVDSARTPWAQAEKMSLRGSMIYPHAQTGFEAQWQLNAKEFVAQSFRSEDLHVTMGSSDRNGLLVTPITINGIAPRFGSIKAAKAEFEAELAHESPFRDVSEIFEEGKFAQYLSRIESNWSGVWKLRLEEPNTEWARARELRISGRSASVPPVSSQNDSLGFWDSFRSFQSDISADAENTVVRGVKFAELSATAGWIPPLLQVKSFEVGGLGGTISAKGSLDVATREIQSSAISDLDLHEVAAVLGEPLGPWLADIRWKRPPVIEVSGKSVFPAGTKWQSNWMTQLAPDLSLSGKFKSGEASFRSLPILNASSDFQYSSNVWKLNNLLITRPEGIFRAESQTDLRTLEFQSHFESHLDPHFSADFLPASARTASDLFRFSEAPSLSGDISGSWTNFDVLGFDGRIGVTNFFFKGEAVNGLDSRLQYTNATLKFSDLVLLRGRERVDIASGTYPIGEEVIDVSNVVSTLDPAWFARISTKVIQKAIGPYTFDQPPLVHAYGRIPLTEPHKADIHFAVEGERFHYWRFRAPRISGGIWWRGDSLSVTNIKADFYDGKLDWEGNFHFLPNDSADYSFRAVASGLTLPSIVADLTQTTNDMKGNLSGTVVITSANTEDMKSWDGFGTAKVSDGFLWNIPLFGAFTHLLGNISPNLGTLPATAATMTYIINNSVVHTDDLEMKTAALRLKYMGTVDTEGRLDAKVEAELLRDTWVFGKFFSVAFWPVSKILEYRVTGTLQTPKSRPLYLPKILIDPIHSIKKIMTGTPDKSNSTDSKSAESPRDQNQNPAP